MERVTMGIELPLPPYGKTGWPWNFMPEKKVLNANLPRVTIVTPSYNHADYLEETIRSVLLQGYPNLEYYVIDGGSTDESVDIIRKYEPWLAGWVSESDYGQSHAINKGFSKSTGEWLGWVNSDDCYAPYALHNLISTAQAHQSDFVYGNSIQFGFLSYPLIKKQGNSAFDFEVIRLIDLLDQPATLWRRDVFLEHGPLSEDLNYAFDWDFFIKCAGSCKGTLTNSVIAAYRLHHNNKTLAGGDNRFEELVDVSLRYMPPSIKERFVCMLPLIKRLRNLQMVRENGEGISRLFARTILRLFRYPLVLSIFGLPIEVWSVQGMTDYGVKKYTTLQYATTKTHTLSEALSCFQDELHIPNSVDISG